MARVITVFSLIASACSIGGFLAQLLTTHQPLPSSVAFPLFAITLILSGYVLLVPGSRMERNVLVKLERYVDPDEPTSAAGLLIQRGKFSIYDFGPATIEFSSPYQKPPEVEIINFLGYKELLPHVERVTPHHATVAVKHAAIHGERTYKWVARGQPLERWQEPS